MKIETFRNPNGYTLSRLTQKEPSCFNGIVRVERYEIEITKIIEPKKVYIERLQKLWDECDNHHNSTPIKLKAESMGVFLIGHYGTKSKKKII